jgi:formimidoylglutamate deiminase
MTEYMAKAALLEDGWAEDVFISVNEDGIISSVKSAQPHMSAKKLGYIIPAMPNLHSHAFQRAMAGRCEIKSRPDDNFWSWREQMYHFVQELNPDRMEEIACDVYGEMKNAGYGSVGEFHYLHHQANGTPYEDIAETSHRMIRAAKRAGLSITHMPVLYNYSGFSKAEPEIRQKPFVCSAEQILDIIAILYEEYKEDKDVRIGFALHSLRAVDTDMAKDILSALSDIDPSMPIHIHAAEQEKEVEECVSFHGQRPVSYILDNFDVGSHWCLVHATHMNDEEILSLAQSGACVGICPETEANLGDGVFSLGSFMNAGGRIGIGSDSHISVNPFDELKMLEYSQRLCHKQRCIACNDDVPSVGEYLYRQALSGGAHALGQDVGKIAEGFKADFLCYDESFLEGDDSCSRLLDTLVFRRGASQGYANKKP